MNFVGQSPTPQTFYHYNKLQHKCKAFYFYGQPTIDEKTHNRFNSRQECDIACTYLCGQTLGKNLILESNHGPSSWGKWGKIDKCPEGEYVAAIQIRSQHEDLNGIRLFCTKLGKQVEYTDTPLVSYLAPDSGYTS